MSNQTAHDTYVAQRAQLLANLARLQAHIEVHASKEAANPRNWGYAGDLTRINELVLQALGEGNR